MIIWPEYLNKNLSLSEGRKISKEIAIKNPTINEITNALRKLKIQFTVEKDKSYPGKWYENNGRIIAQTDKNKLELLKEIVSKMNGS